MNPQEKVTQWSKKVQKVATLDRPWKSSKICLFPKNENGLFQKTKKCKKCKNAVFSKSRKSVENAFVSRDFNGPQDVYIRSGNFDVFTIFAKSGPLFLKFSFFAIFKILKNRPQPHVSYSWLFVVFVKIDNFILKTIRISGFGVGPLFRLKSGPFCWRRKKNGLILVTGWVLGQKRGPKKCESARKVTIGSEKWSKSGNLRPALENLLILEERKRPFSKNIRKSAKTLFSKKVENRSKKRLCF